MANSTSLQIDTGVSSTPPQGSQTLSGMSVGSSTDAINVASVYNAGGSNITQSAEQLTLDWQAGVNQGVVIPTYPTLPSHNNSQTEA